MFRSVVVFDILMYTVLIAMIFKPCATNVDLYSYLLRLWYTFSVIVYAK